MIHAGHLLGLHPLQLRSRLPPLLDLSARRAARKTVVQRAQDEKRRRDGQCRCRWRRRGYWEERAGLSFVLRCFCLPVALL